MVCRSLSSQNDVLLGLLVHPAVCCRTLVDLLVHRELCHRHVGMYHVHHVQLMQHHARHDPGRLQNLHVHRILFHEELCGCCRRRRKSIRPRQPVTRTGWFGQHHILVDLQCVSATSNRRSCHIFNLTSVSIAVLLSLSSTFPILALCSPICHAS